MKRDSLIRALAGVTAAIATAVTASAAGPAKPVAAPAPAAQPAAVKSAAPAAKPAQPVAAKAAAPATPSPAAAKPAVPIPKPAEVAKPGASGTTIPKGLVLHFSFDQAAPKGAVADRSGSNNNGQASGARWTSSGKQGGGFEFSSPANHIKVASSPSLNLKRATFATWFRASRSDGVWRRMLEKGAERGYAMGIAGDTKGVPTRGRVAISITGVGQCLSDYPVCDGSWHHAAATYDGETVKLYLDGNLQKQAVSFRGQIPESPDDLTIGLNRPKASLQDPVQCFEGGLDEVMIFNRALSEEELKTMVLAVDPNAGKPRFTKSQVAGRLRQLKLLFEEGLFTDEFYEAKVSECEAAGQ